MCLYIVLFKQILFPRIQFLISQVGHKQTSFVIRCHFVCVIIYCTSVKFEVYVSLYFDPILINISFVILFICLFVNWLEQIVKWRPAVYYLTRDSTKIRFLFHLSFFEVNKRKTFFCDDIFNSCEAGTAEPELGDEWERRWKSFFFFG